MYEVILDEDFHYILGIKISDDVFIPIKKMEYIEDVMFIEVFEYGNQGYYFGEEF